MTLVLDIGFPFGRYCATPWGRHVNEGAVEWPPSPWRIVRALTASWHVHHPDLQQPQVVGALELLCSPPRFQLPPHTKATTRHYMPTSELPPKKRRRPGTWTTSLGLNPFVAVPPGASIQAWWKSDPDELQLSLLQQLASTVSYLGRAESRVQLTFSVSDDDMDGIGPLDRADISSDEVLDLLVPTRPLDLEAVHTTTGQLHSQRRTTPGGTTWVAYPTPPSMRVGTPRLNRPVPGPPTVVQFTLSGRGRPTMDNAALLAALFRSAVTSRADDRPQLHGHATNHGSDALPRQDDHRHAHYLVTNDPRDPRSRRVHGLVVWTPEGIPPDALPAISRLSRLYVPEHLKKRLGASIDLALVQAGSNDQLDPRLVAQSRHWRTLTPMTTTRHRKKRQAPEEFVEDVVRRELVHRGLPAGADDVTVTAVPDREMADPLQARRTYRARTLGRSRQHPGFHVRLEFQEEIAGPLVLGSLAHFGLGLFVNEQTT